MRHELKIGSRMIGEKHPLFITAECGVTCNFDLDITKKLIDVVAESGADAIKLIFWFADEIMSDRSVEYAYETTSGMKTENMYEMLSKLRFDLDEWKAVKAYADEKGIVLFSTVNTRTGMLWAEELGLEAYKLSSWDFNNLPLWREIARFKKPMIIDTGPVRTDEVAKVMQVMQEERNDQALLVHCYHTSIPEQINMRCIPYMRSAFDALVGFSSKDLHDEMDIVAVALGGVYLEKRLTIRRDLPGHHHAISKEPEEFKYYVSMMRSVQASLGKEMLLPSVEDLRQKELWFTRIVANRDLKRGTVLKEGDLVGKRPRDGVSPEYLSFFLGRELKRDLSENEPVRWEDV